MTDIRDTYAWPQADPVGPDSKGVGVCAGLLVVQREKASQRWPAFLLLTDSSGSRSQTGEFPGGQHWLFGSSNEHNSALKVLTAAQTPAVWRAATFYFSGV